MNQILIDEAATLAFARELFHAAQQIAAEQALSMHLKGDLGVGKTTFARGFIQSAGWQGAVKSPTYTLVEPYELADVQINHFDLYRLADPEELEYMGIRDYFSAGSIGLIEWPDKGKGFLPEADLVLEIEEQAEGRIGKLSAHSEIGLKWLEKVK